MPEKTLKNIEDTFPNDIEYLVFGRRKKEEDEFREYYKKDINDILAHINNIRFIQNIFFLSEPNTTSCIFDEIAIVNKSIDFISSSLVLLAHGSILESLAIIRMAIESSCSALLIHFDEDARNKYLCNDMKIFQSSKAITYAKNKIKYVGNLYGILSNAAVHVNKRSFGPKIVQKDDDGNIVLNLEPFFLEGTKENKKALILLIYLVTFIVERINEIITIEGINNEIGKYRYISCSESSIDKIYVEFNRLIIGST
jgi:hypothetical protein